LIIKSLDASGGSVFRNLLGAAKGALIRAAASTQSFARIAILKTQLRRLGCDGAWCRGRPRGFSIEGCSVQLSCVKARERRATFY